jgi:putative colanic acid biosynthesis UDP-glucose lipid carrier transferase
MTSQVPRIRSYPSLRVALYRSADVLCIVLGLWWASTYVWPLEANQLAAALAASVLTYLFLGELTGNYRSWRGARFPLELRNAWCTWIVTLTSLIVLGALSQHASGFSRASFAAWAILTALLMGCARSVIRAVQSLLRMHGINSRGFAIAGVNELGIQLAQNIQDSPHLGLQLVGFYDDRLDRRTTDLPAEVGSQLGTIDDLIAASKNGRVGVVYITFPMRAEDRIRKVLDALADTTASVYIVPDFFVFKMLHSRWNNIQGLPVVSIFENPFYGVDGVAKRSFDLVLGMGLLALAAAPMALIAMLIKLTSSGPIFFRQRRYGLDGREILVWKFRTMKECEPDERVVQATSDDPRVTRLGRLLRRTSLDELPQLFNVLAGDMSLVGPRPHASVHNEEYRHQIYGYMLRHKVKPGMTGLAQIRGWRGETDQLYKMEKRVECDHLYIRDWSLWLDLKILLQTVFVVFSGKNAH